MHTSTVQFVTQMKLRELSRQRDKLRAAYQALGDEVAGAAAPAERLRRLHDGLRGLKFAGQPLHPDVANLDVLLYEAEAGVVSPDVLELWQERLDEELAAGRLRAEFVYLFGALLEEWAREAPGDARLATEGRQARQRLLEEALAEAPANRHEEVLGPVFEDMGPALAETANLLGELRGMRLDAPVTEGELEEVLKRLAANIYQPPVLRREARRFAANGPLRKELADALTILAAEWSGWDWPAEGLPTRALWTRNKWRLYLTEDLPTACLLEIVGDRWVWTFDQVLGRLSTAEQEARLQKLLALNAPEIIIENQRRLVRQAEAQAGLGLFEDGDVWDEGMPALEEVASGSILEQRATRQRILRDLHGGAGYDEDDENGEYAGGNAAVGLVNAEIRLARAAFPELPLYVVKADLQDFYASIPHDALLTLLRRLGVGEENLAFFGRFLAPPLARDGAGPARMRRGVPMAHTLSAMLAELLLRLLEKHVRRQARVRVVRLVDDICLLSPSAEGALAGWQRLQEFCAVCGLRVNEAKSGAVCLGGELPEGLPRGRPRWGMLELDEAGRWHVHAETFAAHLEQARERVAAAGSVLSRVQLYNANVEYLLSMLAPATDLGNEHRASAGRAVVQFHQDFFGPGHGIVAGLCGSIRERFQVAAAGIPEGWVYWPITASGLGLRNPLVVAGQYALARSKRKPVPVPGTRPPDWNLLRNDWAALYGYLLSALEPLEPRETKVMKTLVNDFIARGSEVSAGRQKTLGSHWRWVLCTYGPQVLHCFGSFRFLITELVPLQLISGQLVQDSSLGEPGGPDDAGD